MLKGLKRKVKILLKDNSLCFVLGYVYCLYSIRIFTGVTLKEYMTLKSFAIEEDDKYKEG